MGTGRSIAVLVAGLVGLWTSILAAQESHVIELAAPRLPGRGEAIQVQIAAGALPPGARLVVMTEGGEVLGALAPFGPDRGGSTVTVPIPRTAMVDRRLRLRLQVEEPGAPPRPPRSDEVHRVDLVLVPHSE